MRAPMRSLAIVTACVLALSACGSDESVVPGAAPTTTELGPTAPLTGLPEDDEDIRNRPLLTVKVDNHPDARPQFGIDKADVIVEEKVEGGLSRFMALFHSQDSSEVGPVRSLRSTDPLWLRPSGGMIAYSGGIDPVKDLLSANGIVDLGADSHGPRYYKRRSDRPFEHSLHIDTDVMRELTPDGVDAPAPLFDYLDPDAVFGGAGVVPVTSVSLRMSGLPTATRFDWTWDPEAGVFRRGSDGEVHEVEDAGQIGMKNVVVQFTPYEPTRHRDAVGSPVDEAAVVGEGEAWMLSDGKIVRGRWSRPDASSVTRYTDAEGVTVRMQRGQTWVSLVPPGEFTEVR